MFRLIDCGMWDDPWFSDLAPDAKLFFLYLITNRRTNPAGAFEITLRAASFETNLVLSRIKEVIEELGDRVTWWPEYQVIWIRSFYHHQKANDKFRLGAIRSLSLLPAEVHRAVTEAYPELRAVQDTPTIPIPTGIHTPTILETVTVTGAETETETHDAALPLGASEADDDSLVEEPEDEEPAAAAPPKAPAAFELFWDAYDRKVNRKLAVDQWRRLKPDDALVAAMLAAIEAQKRGEQWQRGIIKHPHRWLRDRNWTDEVIPAFPARGSPIGSPNGTVPHYLRADQFDEDAVARRLEEKRRAKAG